VRVWDLSSGQCRATLEGHTGGVRSVALSADGGTAVAGSDDRTVRVWDLSSGQCRATLQGHTDRVMSVALSAVRVWDLSSGQCRATLEGHTALVMSVALSADGRTAVSGSWDNTVRVWDLSSGQCRATLEGHTHGVMSVALSADGRTAVSGSWDQTVRVWDLASGHCRAVHPRDSPEARRARESVGTPGGFTVQRGALFLEVRAAGAEEVIALFPGQFWAAACSPDGRHVVAGDSLGQVYILRLSCRDD
jgi:WD40 repeat protein